MFEQLGWIRGCHPHSPLPSPASGLRLSCPFLPGGLPVEQLVVGDLWLGAFSALRQIIEGKRFVFSPKWVYE